MNCLKCGGTGRRCDGTACDCKEDTYVDLPLILEIPEQYQQSYFDKSFLPKWLHGSYGSLLEGIISTIKTKYKITQNYLICAPINSGKSTFAYTVFSILYQHGVPMSKLLDLNEVRRLMNDLYNVDQDAYDLLVKSPIAIIKVPMDVPSRFSETMATIIDLRLRHNGRTIFLFDGSKEDLINLDRFNKFKPLLGDGSYHSLAVYSYKSEEKNEN